MMDKTQVRVDDVKAQLEEGFPIEWVAEGNKIRGDFGHDFVVEISLDPHMVWADVKFGAHYGRGSISEDQVVDDLKSTIEIVLSQCVYYQVWPDADDLPQVDLSIISKFEPWIQSMIRGLLEESIEFAETRILEEEGTIKESQENIEIDRKQIALIREIIAPLPE